MPSETIYLQDDKLAFLDEMVENGHGVNNRSQAVQYCINVVQQSEQATEELQDEE